MNKQCADCNQAEGTVTYFFGNVRCEPCSDAFQKKNREEEIARDAKWIKENPCEECGEEVAMAYYGCQNCCEHEPDPDEGFHCLGCGKDCSG